MQRQHFKIRNVGYWCDPADVTHRLPKPQSLVDPSWRREERDQIVAYLIAGVLFDPMLGYSYCRFRCGIADSEMGCGERTDGRWVWPEGLHHYVAVHHVRLPDEFIDDMIANDWQIPPGTRPPEVSWDIVDWDDDYWPDWARQFRTRS